MRRFLALAVLTVAAVLIAPTAAWADYTYTLSGNCRATYVSSANQLTIEDLKTGDACYVNYKFTNDVCGTTGNACAPSNPGTTRRDATGIGSSTYTYGSTSSSYYVFRLCNDDSPPDTCSSWKRTGA